VTATRRVIFLDIDGVLAPIRRWDRYEDPEPACVQVLNEIVARGRADVVVSSTWRHGKTVAELQQILATHGFTGRVVDTTPTGAAGADRGDEIAAWLAQNAVDGYVIIDDHVDMGALRPHLVQTHPARGLQPADVSRALALLTRPAPRGLSPHTSRRDVLKQLAGLGLAGVSGIAAMRPGLAGAGARRGDSRMQATYDPAAKFEITVSEVELRRTAAGRRLMARVYQPQGPGPFPTVLDLHGGAWRRKDRLAEEPMDRAIATSGILVVAVDLRLSEEAPYPASVQDASYGVRWLKWRAAEWKGDASRVGVYGSSSGGHVAQLLAMRPRDPRYGSIPLPAAPDLDATVAYVATRSPVSDPYKRFQQAERMQRAGMIENSRIYFSPWETIYEGNPQLILERREPVTLVPMLILQGALDDNVLPAVQENFAATYRAAGGVCELTVFENCEHEWVARPGSQTDRAREMVKAFIARQLTA